MTPSRSAQGQLDFLDLEKVEHGGGHDRTGRELRRPSLETPGKVARSAVLSRATVEATSSNCSRETTRRT